MTLVGGHLQPIESRLRHFQLRHMTWNWNSDGTFAGMFLMVVRLHVDQQGNAYSGTWAADSFDVNNQAIPELHAEGIARSRRITVDWRSG